MTCPGSVGKLHKSLVCVSPGDRCPSKCWSYGLSDPVPGASAKYSQGFCGWLWQTVAHDLQRLYVENLSEVLERGICTVGGQSARAQ